MTLSLPWWGWLLACTGVGAVALFVAYVLIAIWWFRNSFV